MSVVPRLGNPALVQQLCQLSIHRDIFLSNKGQHTDADWCSGGDNKSGGKESRGIN